MVVVVLFIAVTMSNYLSYNTPSNKIFKDNLPKDPETGFIITPRHDGLNVLKKKRFLELFLKNQNVTASAKAVGTDRRLVMYHLEYDKAFKAAFDACVEAVCDNLEQVMVANAHHPKGFLDRIAFLRAKRAEVWDRKYDSEKINLEINVNPQAISNANKRQETLEAEIVKPKQISQNRI